MDCWTVVQQEQVSSCVFSTKSKSDYLPNAGAGVATVEKLARFAPKAEQGV